MLENPFYRDEELEMERCQRRRFTTWLAVIVGILIAIAIFAAHAAPQVANPEECGLVADMVLMAAALQKNEVAADKRAAVMEDAYAGVLAGGGDEKKWREILDAALSFSARDAVRGVVPAELAGAVREACNLHRGNLQPIFGSDA